MKNNLSIEDFIKYAKEEFNCDIILELTGIPDTFESIFGVSFVERIKKTDENNFIS